MALGKFDGVEAASIGKLAALDIANVGKVAGSDLPASDIILVGSSTSESTSSINYITVNKPAGVVAGDLLVMLLSAGDAFSALSGWSYKLNDFQYGSSPNSSVLYKVAGDSEPAAWYPVASYVWKSAVIVALRNVNISPTGNFSYGYSNIGAQNFTAPSINIQQVNNWALHFTSVYLGAGTLTAPDGWTIIVTANRLGAIAYQKYLSVGATGAITTHSSSGGSPWVASLLEIKGV
jgi:hypothetical protein